MKEESTPLLDWFIEWGHRPELTCCLHWEKRSLAFWDNRCVKHIAVHDIHHAECLMRGVQVTGNPIN